jgi:hypothetical protein
MLLRQARRINRFLLETKIDPNGMSFAAQGWKSVISFYDWLR